MESFLAVLCLLFLKSSANDIWREVQEVSLNYQDEPSLDPHQGRYPEHVRVVAIFGNTPTSNYDISAAKLFAFTDKGLLFNRTRLVVTILQVPNTDNMLEITGFLCAELQTASNLVGIIVGGVSQPVWAYVIELARGWEVPLIDVFRDPAFSIGTSFTGVKKMRMPSSGPQRFIQTNEPAMMINLHTSYSHIAAAIQDVITGAYKWTRLIFLYDRKQSLIAMQSLLSDTYISKTSTIRETVIVQVTEHNLFDVVKIALKVSRWTTVVVAFDAVMTVKFLKTAVRCGVLTSSFSFFLTNIDIHLYSMEEFAQNWPNVTVVRPIVDSQTSRRWINAARSFDDIQRDYHVLADDEMASTENRISLQAKLDFDREFPFYLTSALVIDALTLFRQGILNTLPDFFEWVTVQPANSLSCTKTYPLLSGYGSYLFNEIRNMSIDGLTGPIRVSQRTGNRDRVTIDVLGLSSKGLVKIGHWKSSIIGSTASTLHDQPNPASAFLWRPMVVDDELKLRITIPPDDLASLNRALQAASIKKKILTVTTLLEKPYAMVQERRGTQQSENELPATSHAVNDHNLEGFCIDLIDAISQIVGFSYRIQVVGDGKYGKYDNSTGRWTGLIGELMERKADIAAAPLTITYARETVVDFTKPFLHLGISILHVQPTAAPPSFFSFMDPLAGDVWGAICLSCIAVTAVFFIVGRCSPLEFDYNSNEDEKHPYTPGETTWFVVGGFLGLGSDISPHALSTRIVTIFWWFFSLIIISSYTANLAAFLTIERHISPFENVEEMAKQTQVLYGTLKGGSTENFFREAKIDTYQRMWAFMKDKDAFARSNAEGIDRVRRERGKYAYLMESVSLQYVLQDVQQNKGCNLRQVGGLLDSKGYGLATYRQSPYRDLLSMAILQLQETDKLQMIYNKWWKGSQQSDCDNDDNQEAKVMGVDNVFGIFVVLGLGFVASLVIGLIEVLWNVRRPLGAMTYGQRMRRYGWKTISAWFSSERAYEPSQKPGLRDDEEGSRLLRIDGTPLILRRYGGRNDDYDDYGILPLSCMQKTEEPPRTGRNFGEENIPMRQLVVSLRSESDTAIYKGPYHTVTQTDVEL